MPNIENLRKQAKQCLRWHRDRHYPVATQISSVLDRFRDLPDSEVLKRDFKLSDAQELVAKQHGFESWPALIEATKTMNEPAASTIGNTVIVAAEPQLFVSHIEAACEFYVRKLGFDVAFTYGEPPFYAQVFRDGARLNLRKVAGPVFDSGFRARERDALAATLILEDAKPLFLEFKKAGVSFHQSLRTEPWGSRTFIVRDPDENLIAFAGAVRR